MSAQVLNNNQNHHNNINDGAEDVEVIPPSPPGSSSPLMRPPPISRSDAVEGSSGSETSSPAARESPVILYRNNSTTSSTGSRDSIVTLKHYDSLLGEIRCPGCARPMHAPIFLCQSGHSVCELCTETLFNCPLCKKDFTEIRSVTLEALAEKAYFLCKYSVHGCTVRLPYHLMRWHKERCVYQVGDCFIGKVWGGCAWSGCEIDWLKHCTDFHADKLFNADQAQLVWNYPLNTGKRCKSVLGFYIFQAYGETFNLYHIYDKPGAKSKWTMVCASKRDERAYRNFAFQVELFVPHDPSRLLIQRHSCHGERDEDVLEEARCVCIDLGDVMRFMGGDKILNYRVKIVDIRELQVDYTSVAVIRSVEGAESRAPIKLITAEDDVQINEWTNHKHIPTENIIKRKSTDLTRMIATIEEELTDSEHEEGRKATVNTNGPIVVHSHNSSSQRSSVYSVCEGKVTSCPDPSNKEEKRATRRNSKSKLLNEINGGYDSVKKMLQKSMSVDRSLSYNGNNSKIQKPPRKFLTLNSRKSPVGANDEFEYEDSVSLKQRRSGSTGDLATDTCSLPDKIPTTPPPKKMQNQKKSNSFINLMRSNLKF